MAVYSDTITNFRAGIREDAKDIHGNVRISKGHIAVGTGDLDDNDIIHLALVPMNAKILSIKIFNDDLDSGSALDFDLGLYYGGDNGISVSTGDLIDRDAYALSNNTLAAANTSGVELAFATRNISVDTEVWEDGGLTSNPGGYAYISATIETAATGAQAGDIRCHVEYVID